MHPSRTLRLPSLLAGAAFCGALLLAHPGVARSQVPFEKFMSVTPAIVGEPSYKIELVTSQEELSAVWAELRNRNPPPIVDFHRYSAIFYFDGLKPTTGYHDEVERIEIQGGVMLVHVVATEPGNGCGTGQLATKPMVAVLTIPWKRGVQPVVRTVAHNCN